MYKIQYTCTVKPVLRGHIWDKEKCFFKTGDLLKEVQAILIFSMTEQAKGDLILQVAA